MAKFEPEIEGKINRDFLIHPKNIFIYPENLKRCCYKNLHFEHLRKWSNGWGLLVYQKPPHNEDPFFDYNEYVLIFKTQFHILKSIINKATELNKDVYIFKMDAHSEIWLNIIKPKLESEFKDKDNIIFLWEK